MSKVMVSLPAFYLILIIYIDLSSASICKPGKEYHDSDLQKCINCTICPDGEVVIRPCELHRDTQCGMLSITDLLNLITPEPPPKNQHRHRHKGHRHKKLWKYGDDVNSFEKEIKDFKEEDPLVASSEAPFSGVETLVWDWQAVALSAAVFTCILFFLVITLYSLHQARQWRRLKESFEHDVDELSASLMAAASTADVVPCVEKGLKGKGIDMPSEITQANYLNRCVYLEQLLKGRKDHSKNQRNDNVYIEETNPPFGSLGRSQYFANKSNIHK